MQYILQYMQHTELYVDSSQMTQTRLGTWLNQKNLNFAWDSTWGLRLGLGLVQKTWIRLEAFEKCLSGIEK